MIQDLNRRKIANLLETLVEQFQSMNKHESRIPRIEIDMMLSNIRSLYESIGDLEKQNTENAYLKPVFEAEKGSKSSPKPVNETEKDEIAETISDFIAEISESDTLSSEQGEIEYMDSENLNNVPETKIEESNSALKSEVEYTEKNTLNESKSKESQSTKTLEPPVLPSLFDDLPQTTVEEKPKTESQTQHPSNQIKTEKNTSPLTIIEKANKKPISNLSAAIGINDKYAFINELFKGNSENYHSVIQDINNSSSKESADTIANLWETKNNWNKESRVYISFMELIERRFLSQ